MESFTTWGILQAVRISERSRRQIDRIASANKISEIDRTADIDFRCSFWLKMSQVAAQEPLSLVTLSFHSIEMI